VWRSKSLESLDSSLRSRKNRLFVFQGSTQEILRRVAAHIRAQKIYAYRGLTSEDRALEDILSGSLAEMGVQLCLTGFDTLFPQTVPRKVAPPPGKSSLPTIDSADRPSCRKLPFLLRSGSILAPILGACPGKRTLGRGRPLSSPDLRPVKSEL
jgi:DNA photolyase.